MIDDFRSRLARLLGLVDPDDEELFERIRDAVENSRENALARKPEVSNLGESTKRKKDK
jgi:hypothetical protein